MFRLRTLSLQAQTWICKLATSKFTFTNTIFIHTINNDIIFHILLSLYFPQNIFLNLLHSCIWTSFVEDWFVSSQPVISSFFICICVCLGLWVKATYSSEAVDVVPCWHKVFPLTCMRFVSTIHPWSPHIVFKSWLVIKVKSDRRLQWPHLFEGLLHSQVGVGPKYAPYKCKRLAQSAQMTRHAKLVVSRLSLLHIRGHLHKVEPFSTAAHPTWRLLSLEWLGQAPDCYLEVPFTMNGRLLHL